MAARFATIAALFMLAIPLAAQDVTVSASIENRQRLIGEWIHTELDIFVPDGMKAVLPASDSELEGAEFVSVDRTEETKEAKGTRFRRTVIITAFDTGSYDARVLVPYKRTGDTTTYYARSNALKLNMTTVQLDSTVTFRDIRDVMHVSLSVWDWLMIIGGVLLLVFLGWYAWRRWKNRKLDVPEAAAEPAPGIPPHVLAKQRLEALETRHLWQDGRHKEYQSEVTDIVREYVERRFDIPALEEITSEIVSDLALAGLAPELVARTEAVLSLADRTKFARYEPTPAEHEAALRYAYTFVDATAGQAAGVRGSAAPDTPPGEEGGDA